MNTVCVSEKIWYMTRNPRVILEEYRPSSLPRSFLPRYGLPDIFRRAFSVIPLRPNLANLSTPSLAWGVYWRIKFIDWAEDGQTRLYEKGFSHSLYFVAQPEFYLAGLYHLRFQGFLRATRNHLSEPQVLIKAFGALLNKFFLKAEIHPVRILQELFDTFYTSNLKFIIRQIICQEKRGVRWPGKETLQNKLNSKCKEILMQVWNRVCTNRVELKV